MTEPGSLGDLLPDDVLSTQQVVSRINELIAICHDGALGYEVAARFIEEGRYKELFLQYARQRRQFAAELYGRLEQSGAVAETEGDLAGFIHRTWMRLRVRLTGHELKIILEECERGEEAAVEVYVEALQLPLARELHVLIDRHYQAIRAARDRLRALQAALVMTP
ncbi:MAG: PA2169 family four-helix-bundle protein [Candidatus Promineifilaceae bacterium]|nr:PA2169 family four-helix-bundle protein [Candidatus Promineifilaceae bacterium]